MGGGGSEREADDTQRDGVAEGRCVRVGEGPGDQRRGEGTGDAHGAEHRQRPVDGDGVGQPAAAVSDSVLTCVTAKPAGALAVNTPIAVPLVAAGNARPTGFAPAV